jgi:predicted nucleic acid-binding protein
MGFICNERGGFFMDTLGAQVQYPDSVPGRIIAAWRHGGQEAALPRYIFDELVRVLPRLPRVRMTSAEVRDLADSFMFLADVVEPEGSRGAGLRDPADQPVLLTLLTAKADCLIAGDKNLLALASQYPVLTPARFWARHGS